MFITYLFIIVGFVFLIGGADLLVDGASGIAKRLHIPEIVIGLTLVSMGTSMPELFVSITSALANQSDMAIGNVIGSNLCNLLLVLGLSTVIMPVMFQKETIKYEIPMCLFFTLIFFVICNTGLVIERFESIILILFFILFIGYTFWIAKKNIKEKEGSMTKKEKREEEKLSKKYNILKCIIFIIIGIIGLKFGGDFVVDNAVKVAEKFNISPKIIGLTILAIGTSLPELVTSVVAAFKGNSDIAIGNIIGSNIFNILFIIGISSFISPITYNDSYNLEFMLLIISTVFLFIFPFIPKKNEMSRSNGLLFLFLYIIYMGMLIF